MPNDALDLTARMLGDGDMHAALALVRRVFDEYEAPEYPQAGVRAFYAYIAQDAVAEKVRAGTLVFWGGFDGETLAGVIALRDQSHISLLFVDTVYHRRGIARRLFEAAAAHCRDLGAVRMTVNSSPYAVEAYRRLGFCATGEEQTQNGIRFIPMECLL